MYNVFKWLKNFFNENPSKIFRDVTANSLLYLIIRYVFSISTNLILIKSNKIMSNINISIIRVNTMCVTKFLKLCQHFITLYMQHSSMTVSLIL